MLISRVPLRSRHTAFKRKMTSTCSLLVLLCVCACVLAKEDSSNLADRELELAEEVAEGYRAKYMYTEKRKYGSSASDQISGYNKPSPQARKLHEEREVNRIQTKFLELLGGEHADVLLRNLKKRQTAINYCTIGPTLDCDEDAIYRTMDGTCNNLISPEWGMAMAQHKRLLSNKYQNGIWNVRDLSNVDKAKKKKKTLPLPRKVSNMMHKAEGSNANLRSSSITHAVLAWGQFLSHDMLSTPEGKIPPDTDCCVSTAKFCIKIESIDDAYFNPDCISATRSDIVDLCTNTTVQNQYNQLTSYIDASAVYGSSDTEVKGLRTYIGGQLTDVNNFPQSDDDVSPCVAKAPIPCMLAGDHRANVAPQLGMVHVLFHREHNRIAKMFTVIHGDDWNDEKVFQETRKIIGAMMQQISYGEYLPKILSPIIRSDYGLKLQTSGVVITYDEELDPTVSSSYAIVNRWGHSLIPNILEKLNDALETTETVNMKDMFSTPAMLYENNYNGIDSVARFVVKKQGSVVDRFIEDSARNQMFENSPDTVIHEFGTDLQAVNLMREREWGVPFYYQFRYLCGGANYSSWVELKATLTHSSDVVDLLESLYIHDYRDIDLLTGVLTEIPMEDSLVGPTLNCMLAKQYKEVKNGDRFWFENGNQPGSFSLDGLAELRKVTLGQLMCRNFNITNIPEDVFDYGSPDTACSGHADINLSVFGV